MKKNFINPEIEIINFSIEDVVTTSTVFDPDGILGDETADNWYGDLVA